MRCPVLLLSVLLLASFPAVGQEVLPASRIRARAARKNLPAIGLPVRTDGESDPVVRFRDRQWSGADSPEAAPRWIQWTASEKDIAGPPLPAPLADFCRDWASGKPSGSLYLVSGPLQGGLFLALCRRDRSSLGWKSIAIVVPAAGMEPGKGVYAYSRSVNWLEHQTGYNLFPRLPSHLQEIIEEMTAAELLCPFQEFDPGLDEGPDPETDYEWEDDRRERD